MSTHNIGFYEDLTKIIFELSSNIIKYTPYFFCCLYYTSAYSLFTQQENQALKAEINVLHQEIRSLEDRYDDQLQQTIHEAEMSQHEERTREQR